MKKKRNRSARANRSLRGHAEKLNEDDGVDPRTYFQSRNTHSNRKDLQLCKQVGRVVALSLGDFGDDVLSGLLVESVTPAPNASQLLVVVRPCLPEDDVTAIDILSRLEHVSGRLRNEVARGIHRKKTPRLVFQVALAPDSSEQEGQS